MMELTYPTTSKFAENRSEHTQPVSVVSYQLPGSYSKKNDFIFIFPHHEIICILLRKLMKTFRFFRGKNRVKLWQVRGGCQFGSRFDLLSRPAHPVETVSTTMVFTAPILIAGPRTGIQFVGSLGQFLVKL